MADETASYEVHLGPDVTTILGAESPVVTDSIDYYDAGVWVETDHGRAFYPYRHVLAIYEQPAGDGDDGGDGGDGDEADES